MEFLDYTQFIDEHNIFDLNALKNTTDTFVSGKQYSYSTSLVFYTASMSSQSHLSRTHRGVGIWWAGWAFANLVYSRLKQGTKGVKTNLAVILTLLFTVCPPNFRMLLRP